MTLVETFLDETDADFRTAMDAILQAVGPDKPNWWHPYEVRGTYEYAGIRFRDFHCIAGSVEIWIWVHARDGGSRRVILVPDESLMLFGGMEMIGRGDKVPVDQSAISKVASNNDYQLPRAINTNAAADPELRSPVAKTNKRDRQDLLSSRKSLWVTPLCCGTFVGIAWLIGRVVPVPAFVYWLIIGLMAFTWIGDLINVVVISRRNRQTTYR